jgi:glycosyltransferase involved in cell wall biosynthesis
LITAGDVVSSATASAPSGIFAPIPGTLSLVLPAFNEEANIEIVVGRALEILPEFTSGFEIIVVNDGSRDATAEIIDRLARADCRVRPVHHRINEGYGGAIKSGFRTSTCEYVMFMDADRQFDIADIRLLSPFVPLFDIVAGFRMERSDPIIRRINAEVFNIAVRILFDVHIRDLDCAFKIFRGDLIRSLELTSAGALLNAETQAKLRRQGATLVQVGVPHYPRVAGQATGGNIKVILRAMYGTIVLWLRMHRYAPPSSAPAPRPYYPLGDALIGSVSAVGLATIDRLLRRRR